MKEKLQFDKKQEDRLQRSMAVYAKISADELQAHIDQAYLTLVDEVDLLWRQIIHADE